MEGKVRQGRAGVDPPLRRERLRLDARQGQEAQGPQHQVRPRQPEPKTPRARLRDPHRWAGAGGHGEAAGYLHRDVPRLERGSGAGVRCELCCGAPAHGGEYPLLGIVRQPDFVQVSNWSTCNFQTLDSAVRFVMAADDRPQFNPFPPVLPSNGGQGDLWA